MDSPICCIYFDFHELSQQLRTRAARHIFVKMSGSLHTVNYIVNDAEIVWSLVFEHVRAAEAVALDMGDEKCRRGSKGFGFDPTVSWYMV
jgi:hypothetical protein